MLDAGQPFVLELEAPKGQALLKVAQPMMTATAADDFLVMQTRSSTQAIPLTTRKPEPAQLGGVTGASAPLDGQRDDGTSVRFRLWAAVRDGHLVWLQCGGIGENAEATMATCARVIETFRFTAPILSPAHQPPAASTLELAAVPGASLPVPQGWLPLPAQLLPPGMTAGFRSAGPAVDGYVPTVLIRIAPYQGSADGFEANLGVEPGVVLSARSPVKLDLGKGSVSQLEFREGTIGLSYDVLVGTRAVEVLCVVPRALLESYRTLCLAMAQKTALR
jgi:hypothetical protein